MLPTRQPHDHRPDIRLGGMGIYNLIHNNDDDLYYYCPASDCPCHQPDYYDSSRNNYNFFNYDDESSSNSRPINHNGTTTNNNVSPRNNFNGYLN
jgi:hypothetical protein